MIFHPISMAIFHHQLLTRSPGCADSWKAVQKFWFRDYDVGLGLQLLYNVSCETLYWTWIRLRSVIHFFLHTRIPVAILKQWTGHLTREYVPIPFPLKRMHIVQDLLLIRVYIPSTSCTVFCSLNCLSTWLVCNNWDIAHRCAWSIIYFEDISGKRHLVSADIFSNLSEERQGSGVEQSGEILL